MNKKEMIEEMANLCLWFENKKCTANPGIDDVCDMSCEFGQAYKYLMREGYRKIPKGSVVLTIEEVDEFRKDSAEVKFLKNKIIEQARKEMAKEFADKLKAKCEWNRKQYCCEATVSSQDIDELAKQCGVEVEE